MSKYYTTNCYVFESHNSGEKRILRQDFRNSTANDIRKSSMEGFIPKYYFMKINNNVHRKKVIYFDRLNENRDKLT